MNYLMYYIEGFIKKYPLDKPQLTIGRLSENDLVIRDESISRKHVQISCHDDYIIVKDLKSTNGINFRDEKVKKARIHIGQSFILGKMEFFLKEGALDEFKLAKELIPIFDTIGSDNEKKFDHVITRYIEDIYSETLKVVMQAGLKKNDFKEFILDLPNHLSNLVDFGSLFILSRQSKEEGFDILLSVKDDTLDADALRSVVYDHSEIFDRKVLAQSLPGIPDAENAGGNARLYAYPLKNEESETTLIFILTRFRKKEEPKIESFLSSLAVEIDLLSQLLAGKAKAPGKTAAAKKEQPAVTDIVAENRQM
ncbi:MAG: FHA domain-containing protein, partial [bacterium]|nr:FHA domain-containing protein [bacterium]